MTKHTIGQADEFPEKKGVKVDVNGIEIAVFKYDGEFHGIANSCPHKDLPLHLVGHERKYSKEMRQEDGPPADPEEDIRGMFNFDCGENAIHCPWHNLEWDLETGRNEVKDMHIATFDITVSDDGDVIVEL